MLLTFPFEEKRQKVHLNGLVLWSLKSNPVSFKRKHETHKKGDKRTVKKENAAYVADNHSHLQPWKITGTVHGLIRHS